MMGYGGRDGVREDLSTPEKRVPGVRRFINPMSCVARKRK